ncbi:MAG: translational GTPase TypA [Bacteroidota bacterium]
MPQQPLRNIAIIAHVDHGKTTLVDEIMKACQVFQAHEEVGELVMDSGDLERERGITITAKNMAVFYKDTKINILDTPGHSDFGGEVERVLRMADGVVLLVDAFEGPMPQTRFVTSKAIEMGLKPIVVVNKVDKPNCDPDDAQDKVFDLLVALEASDEQLDFPTLFGSGKQGWMSDSYETPTDNIFPLLDKVLEHVPEAPFIDGPLQMQITSLDYSNFVGRIAIGKVSRGTLKEGQKVKVIKRDGTQENHTVKELHVFENLGRKQVSEVPCGDICAVVGLEGFEIGDTIADKEQPEALPPIAIEEPTISMLFTVNDSPFYGQDGKFVTSRQLRDRLMKETERNLALKVEETDSPDKFLVYGRGVLHIAVLVETMRREGYELAVGQPQVLYKEIDGVRHEPIEELVVDVPEEFAGGVIDLVTQRKGEMTVMAPKGDVQHIEFEIPSRGLIGLRTDLLTASKGEAIIAHRFKAYQPFKGELPARGHGLMISQGQGKAVPFAMFKLADRGVFMVEANEEVYAGQIVGKTPKQEELSVNLQKGKQLTNVRASGSDDAVLLAPPLRLSLEQYLEFIQGDEYVEVTPNHIRLRKVHLDPNERKRVAKQKAGA